MYPDVEKTLMLRALRMFLFYIALGFLVSLTDANEKDTQRNGIVNVNLLNYTVSTTRTPFLLMSLYYYDLPYMAHGG